jgi:hypothetical protein
MKSIIIVTAYGEDNFYQKQYEDVVGLYSDVNKALDGAKKDGMTNKQLDDFHHQNGWLYLTNALMCGNDFANVQVNYEEETDGRRKPCESSYMFKVYNVI